MSIQLYIYTASRFNSVLNPIGKVSATTRYMFTLTIQSFHRTICAVYRYWEYTLTSTAQFAVAKFTASIQYVLTIWKLNVYYIHCLAMRRRSNVTGNFILIPTTELHYYELSIRLVCYDMINKTLVQVIKEMKIVIRVETHIYIY